MTSQQPQCNVAVSIGSDSPQVQLLDLFGHAWTRRRAWRAEKMPERWSECENYMSGWGSLEAKYFLQFIQMFG